MKTKGKIKVAAPDLTAPSEDDYVEWEKEFAGLRVVGDGDKGLTTRELAARFNVSRGVMRARLVAGIKDGVYRSGKGRRIDTRGYTRLEPVYWLADKKKGRH